MQKSSEASKGVCYRIKQPAESNMLKVSDETLFSGQPPGSSHLSVPRGTPEGNLRTCLPNKVEGLIAGYPEGGRLLRFMINCMDKISSVSNEGL